MISSSFYCAKQGCTQYHRKVAVPGTRMQIQSDIHSGTCPPVKCSACGCVMLFVGESEEVQETA